MAERKRGDHRARLDGELVRLADRLLVLQEASGTTHRLLRRLTRRVAAANRRRGRVLMLTNALVRHGFREELTALGASTFDIADAVVDSRYDGLLVALASLSAEPLDSLVVIGHTASIGLPSFAAELLDLPASLLPAEAEAVRAGMSPNAAAVMSATQLLEDEALRDVVLERASVVVLLLGNIKARQAETIRQSGNEAIAHAAAAGFETVHVNGAGDLIAFARSGLIADARPELFGTDPPEQDG